MRPVPPSGRQFPLTAGSLRATVVEVGGGLRELFDGDRPLVEGYDAQSMCDGGRGQLLIPWPNRIDGGQYTFRGEARQLALTEPKRGCAIHGLTRWACWTAEPDGDARIRMIHRLHAHPGWPHVLDLEAEYTLDEERGLTVRITARNVGDTPAPYGNGAHPYLSLGTPRIDGCTLSVPASHRLLTDERGIPTGTEPVHGTRYDFRSPKTIGGLQLDHAFTGLERDAQGRAWVGLGSPDGRTISLWVDRGYRWLQVFTGDHLKNPSRRRTGLAVEPMSCPPNAFVSGADLRVLEPGDSVTTAWGIVPGKPR